MVCLTTNREIPGKAVLSQTVTGVSSRNPHLSKLAGGEQAREEEGIGRRKFTAVNAVFSMGSSRSSQWRKRIYDRKTGRETQVSRPAFFFYFVLTKRFLPPLRHLVQMRMRLPSPVLVHCKLGCLRCRGMGLYLVARTRLE